MTSRDFLTAFEKGVIGIYKSLDSDEEIFFRSGTQGEIIFVKERMSKKLIGYEKLQSVTSMARSLCYLTTKRLIFFKLFEVSGADTGHGKNLFVGASGSFFEIPLSDISYVLRRAVNLNKKDVFRYETILGGDVAKLGGRVLEIGFNEQKLEDKKTYNYYELVLVLGDVAFGLESPLMQLVKERHPTDQKLQINHD